MKFRGRDRNLAASFLFIYTCVLFVCSRVEAMIIWGWLGVLPQQQQMKMAPIVTAMMVMTKYSRGLS